VVSVRTEANTSDVQVAVSWEASVLQMSDLVAVLDIEDLCGAVATCRDISSVATETHAAHDTWMCQVVNKLDVKHARYSWVENSIPVVAFAFEAGWETVDLKVHKFIANVRNLMA